MTRRVQVQTSNSIGTWIAKNNQLSDHFGDLDLLDSHFESSQYGKNDSNIVSALNHLHRMVDSISGQLFDSGGLLNVNTLVADSAVINRLRANFVYAESADVDSAFTHILRGHQLDYTFAHIESAEIAFLSGKKIHFDSGTIRYLSGEFIDYDSASIGKLTVTDSAQFNKITVGELSVTSGFTFDSQTFTHIQPLTMKDSAGVVLLSGFLLTTDSSPSVA